MRTRKAPGGHVADVLFTLALFCVFAICSMLVIVIGANAYTSSLDRMDAAFDSRTTLSYIAGKIRQNDAVDSIYLGDIAGIPALVMEQDYDGRIFTTYIYHHEGILKELMLGPDSEAGPESGQSLIPVHSLGMEQAGEGIYRFTCTDSEGLTTEMLIVPRSSS